MLDFYIEKAGQTWFGVAFKGETIYATSFAKSEKDMLRGLRDSISVPLQDSPRKTEFAERVIQALKNTYDGKESSNRFVFANDHLPKYTWKILETICKVPSGYVTSYGEVSKAAGGGPRAVGQIMARNPFAPLCPCHRVVRSDFSLGGYGGGLDVKLAFLKREMRGYTSEKEIPINGKKLKVFPAELAIRKANEDKR
jgi:O-6-methylguanine DNA methyltransferase